MTTSNVVVRVLCLTLLAQGCRSRDAPASDSQAPVPASADATPAPLLPDVTPQAAAPVGGYDIAEDELRRATYLTRAVLVRPLGADDAMAVAFGESGLRFARLEADERFGQYSCGGIDENSARPWLDLAARGLALHSPALTRASGTRWIVSCRGLHQGGRPRDALPAGSAGTILLDAEAYSSDGFFRRNLHHELFHMLDFAEGRLVADAEWASCGAFRATAPTSPRGSSAGNARPDESSNLDLVRFRAQV